MRDCRGFTLVELMVVLVIVGLMGAAVVLTAPDDSRTLVREADTFAARPVHAGEEAILTARVVQVTVDAHGYAFARHSFGQWQEIGRAHVLTPDTNAHLVCRLLLENKNSPHLHHTTTLLHSLTLYTISLPSPITH